MANLDETLLDEKLAELETLRAWSPRVMSKLESFLRTPDPWALFRANPFYFAEERGVSEDEAIDLFLCASKVGIFQLTWSLLCPGCGDAVQSFATLKSVCAVFHCYLCATDIETRLDEFVHVAFTVSPKIRTIPAHDPSSLSIEDFHQRYRFARETRLGPGRERFVDIISLASLGAAYLEPGTLTTFDVVVEPGALAAYDLLTNAMFPFVIDPAHAGPNETRRLRVSDGRLGAEADTLAPGKVRFEFDNDTDRRASMILFVKPQALIDEMAELVRQGKSTTMHFDKFLSGRRLLTCQTFRQMFGNETIRTTDGLGVRDISILFTDLKGSTEMYERIGDLKAFALVNQHFERLNRAITRHRGAVVKTIGDAVMASFEQPADAVLAARDMLQEIEAFNREVGEREIVLKVGVHRGASIAVTLNDRLDFFGQTVNVAARVQGLADADEIYITDDVYTAPGVKELLSELSVTARQANLKGVRRAVSVYRVASSAASGS